MKNIIFNRKLILSILMVMLVVCVLPGPSYGSCGFICDIFGGVGDAVGGVGDAVGAAISVTFEAVEVAAGVVKIAAWATDLTVRLVATLIGHKDCVLSTAFSPDGAILASGSCDFTIILWDVVTGGMTATLRHLSPVLSTAFCPIDGCMLASGTDDGEVHLWNPDTGQLNTILTGHTSAVLSVAFSPVTSGLLASGSADSTIRLWDVETGAYRKTFTGHADSVLSVAFSSVTSGLLASGSADSTIRLWDVETGAHRKTFTGHTGSVLSVAFSPDGGLLASGSADSTVRLWDLLDGERLATLDHKSHFDTYPSWLEGYLPSGLWSDGTTMWVADPLDGKLYAYDLSTQARDPAKDFNTLRAARNDNPYGLWSNGTTMWVADPLDGKLYAYDLSTQARDPAKDFNTLAAENRLPYGLWSDGTTMWVTNSGRGGIKLYAYDLSTQARDPAKDFNTLAAENRDPIGLWSDGTTMWVADGRGKLYAYDLSTQVRDPAKDFNTLEVAERAYRGPFPSGLWSDGMTMWVAGTYSGKIYAYEMPSNGDTPAADVPGTPTILVIPSVGKFTVSWRAPGGAAITAYDLRYIRSAAADKADTNWTVVQDVWTAGSGDLIYELTGLTDGTQYDVQVRAVNNSGDGPWSVTVIGTPTAHAKLVAIGLPEETQLQQNAPNPFNSETVISWSLREPGPVRLEVFSVIGQRVAVLRQGHQQAGYHRLHWDSRDDAGHSLASGIYLYRLVTAEGVLTRKLTLLR